MRIYGTEDSNIAEQVRAKRGYSFYENNFHYYDKC